MAPQPTTKRRWYGHPFLIVCLALLLFADLLSIPSDTGEDSTVRLAIIGSPGWRGVMHGRPVLGHPFRTDAGIEWRWPTDADYVPPFSGLVDDDLYGVVVFRDITRDSGLYHLTRQTERFSVLPDKLSAQDEQAMLDAILVAIERKPDYEQLLYFVPDMIRAGVRTRTFPIYSGYARNTLATFVALAFLVCCTRGRPWEWIRESWTLRARRERRGECGSCGYDLTGLDTGRCPECGADSERPAEPGERND